jgi:copper chaperone
MACGACAETITKAVQTLDATATVQADPGTKKVTIESSAQPDQVKQAIAEAGYTVAE